MSTFWDIRSAKYDQLFWVNDTDYLTLIANVGGFCVSDVVLDVGSGTGVVARYLKDKVGHVVCVDISSSMLQKGDWQNMSVVKWDIGSRLFVDNLFVKIVARMVLHHIIDGLDRVIVRCHDMLKRDGVFVVAEGIPPDDSPEVVNWYTQMFRLKEERLTLTEAFLKERLLHNGFSSVRTYLHINDEFSVNNWLENSGIEKRLQARIYDMHVNAPDCVKKAYKMRLTSSDCILCTKNIVLVAAA